MIFLKVETSPLRPKDERSSKKSKKKGKFRGKTSEEIEEEIKEEKRNDLAAEIAFGIYATDMIIGDFSTEYMNSDSKHKNVLKSRIPKINQEYHQYQCRHIYLFGMRRQILEHYRLDKKPKKTRKDEIKAKNLQTQIETMNNEFSNALFELFCDTFWNVRIDEEDIKAIDFEDEFDLKVQDGTIGPEEIESMSKEYNVMFARVKVLEEQVGIRTTVGRLYSDGNYLEKKQLERIEAANLARQEELGESFVDKTKKAKVWYCVNERVDLRENNEKDFNKKWWSERKHVHREGSDSDHGDDNEGGATGGSKGKSAMKLFKALSPKTFFSKMGKSGSDSQSPENSGSASGSGETSTSRVIRRALSDNTEDKKKEKKSKMKLFELGSFKRKSSKKKSHQAGEQSKSCPASGKRKRSESKFVFPDAGSSGSGLRGSKDSSGDDDVFDQGESRQGGQGATCVGYHEGGQTGSREDEGNGNQEEENRYSEQPTKEPKKMTSPKLERVGTRLNTKSSLKLGKGSSFHLVKSTFRHSGKHPTPTSPSSPTSLPSPTSLSSLTSPSSPTSPSSLPSPLSTTSLHSLSSSTSPSSSTFDPFGVPSSSFYAKELPNIPPPPRPPKPAKKSQGESVLTRPLEPYNPPSKIFPGAAGGPPPLPPKTYRN